MKKEEGLDKYGKQRVSIDLPKKVYADFRAAVERRGRSGAFVVTRLMEIYLDFDDVEEAKLLAQSANGPGTVEEGN